jgi:hypothetical protein
VLSNLNMDHADHDSRGQLRRKLKRHILQLRKGKDTERERRKKDEKVSQHREQLQSIRRSGYNLYRNPRRIKSSVSFAKVHYLRTDLN